MIIDKSLNPAKPFAYIAPQSAHKDEQEVLVSIATIFRSLSVEKLENHSQIWVITLKRDPTEEVLEKLILDQNLSANAENREENMNIIFDFLQNNHDHRSSNDFIQTLYDHLDTFTPSTSNAPVSSATAQVDTEDTYRQSRLPLSTMITIKLKRIHQELIELERIGIESNALIKFDLQKSSLYKEKDDDAFGQSEDFTIIGRVFPNSYIYRTVSLQIEIKLESTFPFIPPRVRMLTQIYHPNINENGIICIGILDGKKDWYPQTTLVNVIVDITNLIDNPDLGYSINAEAASNYVHNRAEYDRIAMDFAGKYGLPR
ncbi:hypothetical protein I4U23_021541 [Adineta vaga]|nr:hypothetical protein I4U23_021541 [Adineta vaga]